MKVCGEGQFAVCRGDLTAGFVCLNRVQFETRSANLPKPPGGRPPDSKSMGLDLDAV